MIVVTNFINVVKNFFNQYIVGPSKIKINRLDGISACIRLNDDKYIDILFEQISSIYDEVDEFIIHYNSIKNENDLLSKFKLFPKVILRKYNTKEFNFIEYTNDFIREISFKYMLIWDSDIIFDLEYFKNILRKIKKRRNNNIYFFSGINLLSDRNSKIGFSNLDKDCQCSSFVGCGDFFIHAVSAESDYYEKDKFLIKTKYFKKKYLGIIFLHLSLLNIVNNNVSNEIDFKKIEKNIKNAKFTSNDRFWYKKIIKNTNKQVIIRLLEIKKNKFTSK